MKKIFLIIVIFHISIHSQSAGSIGLSDVRSLSLGNTYTASSYGLYGLGTNPSAIFEGKYENKRFELLTIIPIPNLNSNFVSNFFNLNEYNYFFGQKSIDEDGKEVGRYLTQSDKDRFLDLLKDNGKLMSDIQVTYFALLFRISEKAGAVSFSFRDVFNSNLIFPKSLAEFLLNGNLPGDEFDFSDAEFGTTWLRNYSLSYANSININKDYLQSLNFGITLNFISGMLLTKTEKFNSSFRTDERNTLYVKNDYLIHSSFSPNFGIDIGSDSSSENKSNFSLFPEPSGSGLGIDIGFLAKINDTWKVGLSLTGLGSINWTKNVNETGSKSEIIITDVTDTNQTKELDKKIFGDDNTKKISSTKSSLPTALHFGVAFRLDNFLNGKFPGQMLIVADYNQGLNKALRNSLSPRISFGAEWIPPNWVLEFRTGFSIGEFEKFKWAFGLGLDLGLLEFNIGTTNLVTLLKPNSAYSLSLLFDSKWRF